ncbi:MAG: helix-turn-helix transcriptional regulator [Bacteroidales bacterium]|nr:helix-turn-helix transcriptional regulator [Candidatus Minthousia equi]
MKAKKDELYDVTAELDSVFGKPGTESRRKAEDLAWQEYNAQILLDARKSAGLTQEALAQRIGTSKGYISRLERGLTIPTISTFYRIVAAMGFTVELRSQN